MRRLRRLCIVFGLVLVAGIGGCVRPQLTGEAIQQNPLTFAPGEGLLTSEKIYIRVRDMDIPRTFKLYNVAYFSVVSRDRLRFHVSVVHKWEEYADPSNWNVHLEDDRGMQFFPETKEKRANKFTTKVWDYEKRTAVKNQFGDVVGTRNDGYRRPVALDKVDIYKGTGDYLFHAEDIITSDVKELTLVMEKGGVVYRFVWHLYDPKDGDGVVEPLDSSGDDDEGHEASPWSLP